MSGSREETPSTALTETAPHPGRERLWTPQFLLLIVSAVFMYVSTFMLTPTLPLFVVDIGAGDLAAGGVIVAAYTLGSLVPRLFWGGLVDSWLRQGVYLIGVATIALLSPLYAPTVVLPLIIGIRFLQGVGFSGSSTAASAMSVDLVPASRRAEGIGYYSLANTIGMAIGPDLGLTMLQRYGSTALFTTSVLAGAASFALGMLLRYEHARRTEPSTASHRPALAQVSLVSRMMEPAVLPVSVVFLFVVIPYGGVMAFIAAYGLEQGVTRIGLYFSVFAVALFAVRLFIGKLGDRHGVGVVLVPGIAASVAGLAVLWWASSLIVFLASAVLFGLGFGISVPLLQAAAYGFVSADRRGTASATFFATADIGYGVGAIALGVAMANLDHRVAFAGLSLIALLALPAYAVALRPRLVAAERSSRARDGER